MIYYGTEAVGGVEALSLADRLGRCYELAGYALALGSAPADAVLVHGTIQGRGSMAGYRLDHAWLVLADGSIWEPATASLWSPLAWDALAAPAVEVRYSADEVRDRISSSGNWGPWYS